MAFFKLAPNLPDDEKARIEFHLQQIAECIGLERLTKPVANESSLLYKTGVLQTTDQIMNLAGRHLGHDVGGITIETVYLPPETTGGGG